MRQLFTVFFLCFFANSLFAQNKEAMPLFKKLSSTESGIQHYFGKLEHAGLEGGGVAVGFLDGDSLPDFFIIGDSLHGLYKNLGNLKFGDKFSDSGIPPIRGATSVFIHDINQDGKADIIIGRRAVSNNPLYQMTHADASLEQTESNLLIFLNCGDFKFCQDPDFTINTQRAVSGLSLADFDKNGLIDVLISSWDVDFTKVNSSLLSIEEYTQEEESPVQLFMQTKKGEFVDQAAKLGIIGSNKVQSSFSCIASDLNSDGWVDIILSQDFDLPDRIFINKDGEFEEDKNLLQTMSFYSMGMDAADITNNGLIDFMVADMRPLNYYRQKTVKYEKLFDWNSLDAEANIKKQNVRNTLFVNQGDLHFSEIGQMLNIDATDWSWSVLLADFNNNSHKDIFVSNGYYYQDFFKYDTPLFFDSMRNFLPHLSPEEFLIHLQKGDSVTAAYFKNFFFANNGNLSFENKSAEWQEDLAMNTRGAAYADFDLDGDLDLLLNNVKEKAILLENKSNEIGRNNFLRIKLSSESNKPLMHTRAEIFYAGKQQLQELQICRGFYSASENILHFGLGKLGEIDSVRVTWPNGSKTLLKNVAANQLLNLEYEKGRELADSKVHLPKYFEEITLESLAFKHQENVYNDLIKQPLLPQKYSKEGPTMAVGDLNGNGLEDLIIGASASFSTRIYFQNKSGEFQLDTLRGLQFENWQEDASILIFDFNKDGFQDILIASGGNEFPEGDAFYEHRIYQNDSKGNFERKDILGGIKSSASAVRLTYFDSDSLFPVLFIAGRLSAQNYPIAPNSYLLKYDGEKFVDISESHAPELKNIGMLSDAIWTDFNQDGQQDLLVLGEYMSPVFFENDAGFLKKIDTELFFGDSMNGFWNCVKSADFNQDGFPDYVFGNRGLNTRYKASKEFPLKLYAADFDSNTYLDIISAYYEAGTLFPSLLLNTFKNRLAGFSKKYFRHSKFASSDLYQIFDSTALENAIQLEVHTTASVYLESSANGKYNMKYLPIEAQFAPIQDIEILDIDSDGKLDLLLVGNFFPMEPLNGAYTALNGLLLTYKLGEFVSMPILESAFSVNGDCREIISLQAGKEQLILVSRNENTLKIFRRLKSQN